jgi:uncharacterized protein
LETPDARSDRPTTVALENQLVVQGTTYCNIDCKYCHLPDRNIRKRMSVSTFEKIIDRVVSERIFTETMTVVWRSGEPLTLPIEFYKDCVAITGQYADRISIRHVLQTNGMLITRPWCRFFLDSNISVRLSLDGPAFLHNQNRVDRCGNGTFRYVARGLALLEMHGVPFSIICVMTYGKLDYLKEIFEFFSQTTAQEIILNIDEAKGANGQSSFQFASDGPARYRAFVKDLLALNEQNGFPLALPNVSVDLLRASTPLVNNEVKPWAVVSVDTEGNISTFSPELLGMTDAKYSDFVFGNLLRDPIPKIVQSRAYQQLIEDVGRGVELCRAKCDYFDWCGGGSPANKYFEHGSFEATETMHCRLTKKAVCDANLELLEQEMTNTVLG